MNREGMISRVRNRRAPYDIIIIGGGATGAGCALDAAARGYDVLLLEQYDFGKGTSSRSTKLVHGGVRYLEQGNISLVREALKERGILKQNAPHLIRNQTFIIPCYSWWQKFYYGIGLKVYDLLSGGYSLGRSKMLSRTDTLNKLPNLRSEGLSGGVSYFDGQFDDARLLIELINAAAENGAAVLNYARVVGLSKNTEGKTKGVKFECGLSGESFAAGAKVVINATGAFTDEIRKLASPDSEDLVTQSQGIHLVFDPSFLSSDEAIMIPKTSDGRVLFAIPWNGKTLIGTTDTPIGKADPEPHPLESEIGFILETVSQYLSDPPTRKDVLSAFAGIRPLVKNSSAKNTASLSRDHTIETDETNLLTITGGKWTTYRHMAEDAIDRAAKIGKLAAAECVTHSIRIKSGRPDEIEKMKNELPVLAEKLHKDFEYLKADVVYAVRNEMAQTVEDVLARRTRILFLDAQVANGIAPVVAKIMAVEMDKDQDWIKRQLEEFEKLARNYLI
ncbi:MAG: glycerol-3-phosphate dehydrogenase/oxidase [Pyrinomonadaceae bacterium]